VSVVVSVPMRKRRCVSEKSEKSSEWPSNELNCIHPIQRPNVKEFQFVDGGHTFFCSVEAPRAGMAPWWWFRLDSSGSTRYAPFEASANDTQQSVRKRIIAYYAELLAIQARPVLQKPAWRKPERPATPAGTVPVAAPVTTTA
jgi:hypothetical protein